MTDIDFDKVERDYADTFGYTPNAVALALRLVRARDDEDADAYRAVFTEIDCRGCLEQVIKALVDYVDADPAGQMEETITAIIDHDLTAIIDHGLDTA